MTVTRLPLAGLLQIALEMRTDARGFFVEQFDEGRFRKLGLPASFAQDNRSRSWPRVLRGLHYQRDPWQGKLISVARGRIFDVAVDLRPDSPTFGQSHGCELADQDGVLLWLPAGFAHGFCVLGDEPADIIYKVDAPYNRETEGGIFYADPELAIPWPVTDPIMSDRDRTLPSFAAYRAQGVPPVEMRPHLG